MGRFRDEIDRLLKKGVDPVSLVLPLGGGGLAVTKVTGFTLTHIIAACGAWTLFLVGTAGIVGAAYGYWIADARERSIVEGVDAAGVDVRGLSAADIRGRLKYDASDGRILVDAIVGHPRDVLNEVVAWLRTVAPERRQAAMSNILAIVSTAESNADKSAIVGSILTLDDATASVIRNSGGDVWLLLKRLSELTPPERAGIIATGFPIKPFDADRARLWATVNAPEFPAASLIAPLESAAHAHHDRLVAVENYLRDGTALPMCAPVACQPSACVSRWDTRYTCEAGYYPTVSPPTCIKVPAGMTFAP